MMRIAIVHDWLTINSGSERVLEQLLMMFPQADIYTVVDFMEEKERGFLAGHSIYTTFLQDLPFAKKSYRNYLPLMPIAVEQLDLSTYDLVLSSSHAVAKGVITGPDQLHISYIHSPIRYAWDLQHQYLIQSGLHKGIKGIFTKWLLHYIRMWDVRTANGVDHFVANSEYISRRINKVYNRTSDVIYPPVSIEKCEFNPKKEDFYLTVSRFVPYKRMDLIVEAFTEMNEKKLIVIGDGPTYKKVREKAGENVEFLGYQPNSIVQTYMQRAKAFVFAAEEDFGITLVEAQACGTPVIAFGKGGALETVNGINAERITGLFYYKQTKEALIEAVRQFEGIYRTFNPYLIREHVSRFSAERFRSEMKQFIEQKLVEFNK